MTDILIRFLDLPFLDKVFTLMGVSTVLSVGWYYLWYSPPWRKS